MSVPAGIDYQTMFADQIPERDNPNDYADTHHAGDKDAPWLYWRLPDGRVQLLKGGPNGLERAMRGCMPLSTYGMIQRATRGDRTATDEFSALVARNGAHELPAEQVLGLRWHRRPNPRRDTWSHQTIWQRVDMYIRQGASEREALEQVLPQLRGVDIPETLLCGQCPGREFLKHDDLVKHEGVMHREDVRTREMRESISDALRTQGQGGGDMAQVIGMMAEMLAKIGGQNEETRAAVDDLVRQIAPMEENRRRRGRPPKASGDDTTDDDGD